MRVNLKSESIDLKHAPKIFRAPIDWNQKSADIVNFVRGMNPSPGTTAVINEKTFRVFKVSIGEGPLKFKTADGFVSIEELQPEGKKRMKTSDFLRGYKI